MHPSKLMEDINDPCNEASPPSWHEVQGTALKAASWPIMECPERSRKVIISRALQVAVPCLLSFWYILVGVFLSTPKWRHNCPVLTWVRTSWFSYSACKRMPQSWRPQPGERRKGRWQWRYRWRWLWGWGWWWRLWGQLWWMVNDEWWVANDVAVAVAADGEISWWSWQSPSSHLNGFHWKGHIADGVLEHKPNGMMPLHLVGWLHIFANPNRRIPTF